jgi:hypothetical protein
MHRPWVKPLPPRKEKEKTQRRHGKVEWKLLLHVCKPRTASLHTLSLRPKKEPTWPVPLQGVVSLRETMSSCCFKLPSQWYMLQQPWENNTACHTAGKVESGLSLPPQPTFSTATSWRRAGTGSEEGWGWGEQALLPAKRNQGGLLRGGSF